MTVSAERFLDVSDSSAFRSKLAWLEIVDVFIVVEHESNSGRATVDLEWMTTENNALENDSIWCT